MRTPLSCQATEDGLVAEIGLTINLCGISILFIDNKEKNNLRDGLMFVNSRNQKRSLVPHNTLSILN